MESKNKQVAEKIIAILQDGLTLNADTQHYIDSTFSNPSEAQKRACAKGRSREMQSTFVFSNREASSLNFRAEVAQTPVSTLGKIFSTFR